MSDCVYSTVQFRVEYLELVKKFFKYRDGTSYYMEDLEKAEEANGLVTVIDEQANYGNMDWIMDILDELQIPHDHYYGQGSEFMEADVYVRYCDGEYHSKEVPVPLGGLISFDVVKTALESSNDLESIKKKIMELESDSKFMGLELSEIEPDLKALELKVITMMMKGE